MVGNVIVQGGTQWKLGDARSFSTTESNTIIDFEPNVYVCLFTSSPQLYELNIIADG